MLSESEIVLKLKGLGCRDADIPRVMQEIGLIICGKAFAQYMEMLPEEERGHVRTLRPEELDAYIEEKDGKLPRLSQQEFDATHDEIWQEYLTSMGKKT